MTSPTPTTQRQRAEVLLNFLTNKVLNLYGKSDVSALAWKRFSTEQQVKTVVVVGEVSRGKSALANALVGARGSSPVGVNFTTAVSVGLGQAAEPISGGDTQLFFSDHTELIDHRDLEDHIDGCTQSARLVKGVEVPTRAFISLSESAIDGIVIDTPGVGGLNPDHALLARNSADQASVLVVACDASTPVTAPEMDFIKTASRQVDNVIVAVTKIDKHFSRWKHIVEEDKKLLEQHLGRRVPVVGVSSLLAVYDEPGLSVGDIEEIHRNSGIVQLRSAINKRFTSAENIPAINGLRVAAEGLKDLRAELEEKVANTEQTEEALPGLEDQLDRLTTLKKEMERWEQYLNRDFTLARQKALDYLDGRLEEIKTEWTDTVSKNGMSVLRKSPQHFTALMEKDFQEAVLNTLDLFSNELETGIVQPRFDSKIVWEEIANEITQTLSNKTLKTAQVKGKSQGIFDPMMLMMGASGGSILGTALASIVSFTGLGVIAGVGWVTFNVGFRAMRSGKQNLLAWLRETTGTARTFTSRLLEAAIANARPAIVIRYREHLRTSIEETQKQIKTAQNAAAMEKKTRDANIARLRKNIVIINKNLNRIDTLVAELRQESVAEAIATEGEN